MMRYSFALALLILCFAASSEGFRLKPKGHTNMKEDVGVQEHDEQDVEESSFVEDEEREDESDAEEHDEQDAGEASSFAEEEGDEEREDEGDEEEHIAREADDTSSFVEEEGDEERDDEADSDEHDEQDAEELAASGSGKCTKKDQGIMNKMGPGNTKGKWPRFVKDCTDHSVRKFPPAWKGHSGMVSCIRQKKVSKGCATCFADMSKHGFDNCKMACMTSWCSAGCLKCTRGNKAAHSKLVKCTGMKKMPAPKQC